MPIRARESVPGLLIERTISYKHSSKRSVLPVDVDSEVSRLLYKVHKLVLTCELSISFQEGSLVQ